MNRKTHPAVLFHLAATGLSLSVALGVKPAIAQSYTLTTFANFNGANGQSPVAGVTLDSDGNLYGTTYKGGTSGVGTVFKIAAGTNTITTLATFSGAANGQSPDAGITLDSDGNLYGTTEVGGANNDGTVFKIAVGTNKLTTLATFNGTANGRIPIAGITLDSRGNLYGTTAAGGANGDGTVFEIAAGTNTLTTLATFNGSDGLDLQGGVTLDSRGNLYGTTHEGGANGDGTVFKLTPSGSASAPEPAALALLLHALASLGLARRAVPRPEVHGREAFG